MIVQINVYKMDGEPPFKMIYVLLGKKNKTVPEKVMLYSHYSPDQVFELIVAEMKRQDPEPTTRYDRVNTVMMNGDPFHRSIMGYEFLVNGELYVTYLSE